MTDLLEAHDATVREQATATPMPVWVEPMRATLADTPFDDEDWIFERKLDGIRCLAYCDAEVVDLYTRNKKRRNNHFPELVEALEHACRYPCILDGEVVAFEGRVTSFARLQKRAGIDDPDAARDSGIKIFFYIFDCVWANGYDLRRLTVRERKRLLQETLSFTDPVRYTPHRNADGLSYFEAAYSRGWEGLIAKRADSTYTGSRTKCWRKLRCDARQEFVIGGFTDPEGERQGFGALLLGYYDNDVLRYAGRVGTGFDERMLAELSGQLNARVRRTSPFTDEIHECAHWVSPDLVAEIAFTEWTDDNKLRHPSFIGLRDDKPAENVVREMAQTA